MHELVAHISSTVYAVFTFPIRPQSFGVCMLGDKLDKLSEYTCSTVRVI